MMQNEWKMFKKMTEDKNFYLFGSQEWPENQASEAHVQHNSVTR